MFDNKDDQQNGQQTDDNAAVHMPPDFDPAESTTPTATDAPASDNTQIITPSQEPTDSGDSATDLDLPGVPMLPIPEPDEEPAEPTPVVIKDSAPSSDTPTTNSSLPTTGDEDLLAIKQQALQQLTPLVDKLDQSPEDKFKTTMMMIQASDDQTLVKTAHEAAMAIEDEETKAKALLDIVNEINYFTSQKS